MKPSIPSGRSRTIALGIIAVLSLTPCAKAQSAPDWDRIARLVVQRIGPVKGERVLLVGVQGMADQLIPALRTAVRNAGAEDLGVLPATGTAAPEWQTPFTQRLAAVTPADLETVDVAVMLPGAGATHAPYIAMQRVLGAAKNPGVRTIHFHWMGAYSMSGVLLDLKPEYAALYQRALLQTDYAALGAKQAAFERAMRNGEVRVTTPAGTDISFRIGDRPVTKQDGDGRAQRMREARNLIDREVELPAGAIRVAPIEETVTGTIAFPPSSWAGEQVEGLVMRFERGQVVSFEARSGRAAVERELQTAGAAGRSFREFALGFNPLLAIPGTGEPWIPYYGYGAGVVRLSLGDNSELGGKVTGGYVRWNFFTDATVSVGRDTWVRAGKLIR